MAKFVLAVGVAVLLAGCFPQVIDVDGSGRALIPRKEGVFIYDLKSKKVELLAKTTETFAQPYWARWTPDGKKVLVGGLHDLRVVDVKDKTSQKLGRFQDVSCALWSPDGKSVSLVINGDLKVLDVARPEARTLLPQSLIMHRWLPGGKILAFRIKEKIDRTSDYSGDWVLVNPAGDEPKVVAAAIAERCSTLDVSPDGSRALYIGSTITGEDSARKQTDKLVIMNLADGKTKDMSIERPCAAFWSPDGKRMVILQWPEHSEAPGKGFLVIVADAEGQEPKVVAKNVVGGTDDHDHVPCYPSWADNETVLYFNEMSREKARHVARSIVLTSVKFDGTNVRDLQESLDQGVAESEKKLESETPK
jgi:Tol biopolymer transport system component